MADQTQIFSRFKNIIYIRYEISEHSSSTPSKELNKGPAPFLGMVDKILSWVEIIVGMTIDRLYKNKQQSGIYRWCWGRFKGGQVPAG